MARAQDLVGKHVVVTAGGNLSVPSLVEVCLVECKEKIGEGALLEEQLYALLG